MAKNTKQKIIWALKSVRNWFSIKYHRWFKKEQPVIFTPFSNDYTFEKIDAVEALEAEEDNVLYMYKFDTKDGENPRHARMRAAKALTDGYAKEGDTMPKLLYKRDV